MALSYLFECVLSDGTSIIQTQEDISTVNPSSSAFYDVLARLDDVVRFTITNEKHIYSVDLLDGHFELDGVPFRAQNEQLPQDNPVYRLIYFRRHIHQTVMGGDSTHAIEYFFGWQTTIDGKNYQQTISVS